jgi:hypothetical protein
MTPWIGVDLDGTLAHYTHGSMHRYQIGEPIPKMVELVKVWLEAGLTVKIVTARANKGEPGYDPAYAVHAIQDWCEKHIGRRLEVTASKDFMMLALWDDRAQPVSFNEGNTLVEVADLLYRYLKEFPEHDPGDFRVWEAYQIVQNILVQTSPERYQT